MTAGLSPDDLAGMRRRHVDLHNTGVCYRCEQLLPCDAVRLLDEVERLRGEQKATAPHVDWPGTCGWCGSRENPHQCVKRQVNPELIASHLPNGSWIGRRVD